jgi:TolB protein
VSVLAAALTVASLAALGAESSPGDAGRIVFTSERAPDLQRTQFLAVSASSRVVLATAPGGAVLAPDGRRYAFVRPGPGRDDALLVAELDGEGVREVASTRYSMRDPAWSPDGSQIAYEVANPSYCRPGDRLCAVFEIWIVPAAGGSPRMLASAATRPVWSPGGRMIAYAGEWNTADANEIGASGRPYVVAAGGGTPRLLSRVRGIVDIDWAPDERRISFSAHARSGFVAVAPLTGAGAKRIAMGRAAAWISNTRLAIGEIDGAIGIVRADGRRVRTIRAVGVGIEAFAWSPARGRLAYVTRLRAQPTHGRVLASVAPAGGRSEVLLRADRFQSVLHPRWDRANVVISTFREQNDYDLFTMRGDGSDVRRVTDEDQYEFDPSWSPDGKRIVFLRIFPGGFGFPQTAVHVVDGSGGAATRITSPTAGTDDNDPEWSPDGTWIVFSRSLSASGLPDAELYMCRPDGAGLIQLTRLGGWNGDPDWSPDGSWIAFAHSGELWVIRPDGTDARSLGLRGSSPSWSPDGSRIAYLGAIGNVLRLLVASADGSDHRVVSWDVEPMSSAPTWSPDATRLIYEGKDGELHAIAIDGAARVDLTQTFGRDADPDWSAAAG